MRAFKNAKGKNNGEGRISPAKILSFWEGAAADRLFVIFFVLWLLPLVLTLIFLLLKWRTLPSEVPLFYSRVWGEGQLAKKEFIFLVLGGVFFWGIVNQAAAMFFLSRDKVMTYLLCGTSSLLTVLTAVTIFNIVNLFV